ncbi:MAG: M48 family metallopeptidase [Saprospiraceae bacterium]|nr:M48 family metallopeptidase [Saprospiraceae bacterium]
MFIALRPSIITVMLGLGIISMGVLIIIFLLKFIFAKHKVDRSHLIEISRTQEPRLFELIGEIVEEVETNFPKKVYLSADVNAAVFYDSSFWSMFFPIKKNLQIGVGLINAVSVSEFKAILAHEFGHFSQRTMKVGSYVYNVNQIIYSLLHENRSYNSMAQQWASISGYFAIFVNIAVVFIKGIQWILKQVYDVVNLNYMRLSREMEFHADEVAANVAGSKPLITSLLRLDLANHSYQIVLNYYGNKVAENIRASNIYPQQRYVMEFLARKSNLPVENNLPQVTLDHLNRYNKSRLVIKDQ